MIPNTPDKMNVQEEQEIKKEFLLERVVLFSDAVFAIIITIMVIEIKLPAGIREATDGAVHHAFKELMFKLGGYAFTFFLVANFWIRHIRICSYLKDYNKMFLVFNLLFLFNFHRGAKLTFYYNKLWCEHLHWCSLVCHFNPGTINQLYCFE
jgi:hypothetical protein